MKVLMFSWEFPPRIIGGLGRHVYHLSRALAQKGINVHVVTCDFPDTNRRDTVEGVEVTRVDSGQIAHPDQLLWTYNMNSLMIEEAKTILKNEQYDLIHAHDWMVARAAFHLKKNNNIPLVSTIHATEKGRAGVLYTPHKKTIHHIEQLLAHQSDRIICCSNFMRQHLEQTFSLETAEIDVIPNGIDPLELAPFQSEEKARQARRPGLAGKTILYVGRMVREKGLHTLLEAFEQILKNDNEARLVLVGEGPLREELTQEVHDRKIQDYVNFTGYIDQQTLVELYHSSDLFVLSSHYEPFGISVLEAMASGLPVVVSDSGGLSEIVEDRITGLKVPPHNTQALAGAIMSLMKDGTLAEGLVKNAHRMIREKYDWNSIAEKTIHSYDRALVSGSKPATISDEAFISEQSALQLLFTLGAGRKETARSSRDLAAQIRGSETDFKLILGRLVSQGYVTTLLESEGTQEVRYHLTGKGIIKSHAGFS